MGASDVYAFPNQKLVFRTVTRPRNVRKSKDNNADEEIVRTKPLGDILDEFDNEAAEDKRKYSKFGHLNPKNLNNVAQNRSDKPVFGNQNDRKSPDLGQIIDELGEFDSIKIEHDKAAPVAQLAKQKAPVKSKPQNQTDKSIRKFIPSAEQAITKKDHAKVASKMVKLKSNETANTSKLEIYREFLNTELQLANCPSVGPNTQRLRIYSELFEMIIKDFHTYDDLLAEIKNEYDNYIESFCKKEDETAYLRTKIQKLLAQNENRVLLKFEKQRCKELEMRISAAEEENLNLKKDIAYKLQQYSVYLPSSSGEPCFVLGKDPISIRDKQIADKDRLLKQRKNEIEHLKLLQAQHFVPKIEKEELESKLTTLEENCNTLKDRNSVLENTVKVQAGEIERLQAGLMEKDKMYQFLLSEYSEMCANMPRSSENVESKEQIEVP